MQRLRLLLLLLLLLLLPWRPLRLRLVLLLLPPVARCLLRLRPAAAPVRRRVGRSRNGRRRRHCRRT